jgi:hypothetical protein
MALTGLSLMHRRLLKRGLGGRYIIILDNHHLTIGMLQWLKNAVRSRGCTLGVQFN